jgi:uncharacterized protein (DUF608 family)
LCGETKYGILTCKLLRILCALIRILVEKVPITDEKEIPMTPFTYKGNKTKEISFPLGGIGTGCIGLTGNGRLIDWEIHNRPNKGSTNGFSHFAIKAESDGRVLDARILHGDLLPPYVGQLGLPAFASFGWGPSREYLTGMPHFRDVIFRGEFPIANLTFTDETFPGSIRLTAFNPFIPLNERDSGIPGAFFEIEVNNPTTTTTTYTVCGTLKNPLPKNNVHTVQTSGENHLLHLTSDTLTVDDVGYGDLTLATDAEDVSHQAYWFRGAWFDNLEVFWHDFTTAGPLNDRHYPIDRAGDGNHGTLAAHIDVRPGATRKVRFVITWNFPNCENSWNPHACECARQAGIPNLWKNYYATMFEDSTASAAYSLKNWERLYSETLLFKETLFASDLPPAALDAVSANLSILKSPTVLRLEDGTFYGWEGCHPNAGCCEGSCTHVWNYAQAVAFLFPNLERSMRSADYHYNLRPDGGMSFRIQLPLGVEQSSFRPCADGQFGGVIKAYRDWKISGNIEWLRSIWEAIKKSIEFAWAETNEDRWDPDRTGVLHGRQHHTLDMELFGPNSWLTGFYLGALKAGAEMAEYFGEVEKASEYRTLFEKGKRWVDTHLFNGEYYQQDIDLKDMSLLERYRAVKAYWNDEHREIKYQIGEGCEIDQVIAQWHASICGLGEIFDPEQTRRALRAIYTHNFKNPIRDLPNPWRIYCLNDEAGLVICDWPEGKYRPIIPLTYATETMNGYEYAAAILMIQSGLIDEGMNVVKAIRDRYDGEKRNPWNEFECGGNYARSMASYALLNAFSGFEFNAVTCLIGFNPVRFNGGKFGCFWSLDSGWGVVVVTPRRVDIEVRYGHLDVRTVNLPFLRGEKVAGVFLGKKSVGFTNDGGKLTFHEPVRLEPGRKLTVRWKS